MTEVNKAADKIRKLLNMTIENGCTEDEAESALRMAAGLAARAGIELNSLRAADAPKLKAKAKRMSQEYKVHQTLAAAAAACLFGVECNYYDFGKNGITFVGREENIELTEHTWFWIMRQIEELYKTALPKGLDKTTRGEFRRTFKEACAVRVKERAEKLMRDIKQGGAQAATGHNALVVTGYFEQLEAENDEFWNARTREAQERHAAYLAGLTQEQRDAIEQRQKEHAERAAKKPYKAPRGKTLRAGVGTQAGFAAAAQVKLRDEVR